METRVVTVGALIVLLAMSGCVGFVTGKPLEFTASPAAVSNSSAAEAGYTFQQYNETQLNKTVDVVGVEREVRLSFHRAIYTEQVPEQRLERNVSKRNGNESGRANESRVNRSLAPSAVTIISLPDAKFFGKSVNPLVHLPNDELIKRFAGGSHGSLDDLEKASERSVQVLDSNTTLTVFNATAETENGSTDAQVSIAKTEHEGDVVLIVAIDPSGHSNHDQLDGFIAKIEHPTDAPR
ncbi:MAG: DUF6517 family protein [Halorientalis sp.]